jgi:LuxR family maltose regulon positive regulatory protein
MQQQRPIPAIRHALKAGAMDAAMPLLLEHADSLLQQGRIGLLTQLMDQVPAASLDQHPHLKLLYAHCLTYTRGPRQGHALIETMQAAQLPADSAAHLAALRPMQLGMMDRIHEAHAQGLAANLNPHTAPHNALVTLSQALTQTSIILGEHEQARQFCDQARYAQGTASDRFNRILAETAEATMELMRGHLKQATQRIRLALNPAANHRLSRRGITMATIQLAETLYEQDQCTEARKLLLTNSALVQDMGPPDTLINANVILARIVAHAGDTDHALQLLIELEHSGHRLQLPRVVASARLERARLWLLRGNCSAASEQLALTVKTVDWNSITPLWFSANDTLIPAMVQARLHMQTGEAGRAVSSLRHDLKNAEREQRARRALKLRILLAEALFASGDRNSALRTLTLALNSAAPEGFIRTFIEEGAALAPLLGEIKSLHGHDLSADASGYFRSLEAGFLHPAPARITVSGSDDDQLTGKELEVLKVLALGLSNNAMAEKRVVSESTVRTHLRNINLKLHASNRTEAVSIARQIGLLG